MNGLTFTKLLPGGNTTIILTDTDISAAELPNISAALMSPLHLYAEQVGALSANGEQPHLQMMGGEFCVNATRAAAFILTMRGFLTPVGSCLSGTLTVSGAAGPVRVLVSDQAASISTAIAGQIESHNTLQSSFLGENSLVCAACIDGEEAIQVISFLNGAYKLKLPGITHILVDLDKHPMPEDWRKASSVWRKKAGEENSPASGVIWFESLKGTGYRIFPAVEVKATGSEHMETACGSASLALAIWDYSMNNRSLGGKNNNSPLFSLEVLQPSGEFLSVFLVKAVHTGNKPDSSVEFAQAWVSGKVTLLAEGRTFV